MRPLRYLNALTAKLPQCTPAQRITKPIYLRLWRDGPGNHWRASLQSTKASEVQFFADVRSLLNF